MKCRPQASRTQRSLAKRGADRPPSPTERQTFISRSRIQFQEGRLLSISLSGKSTLGGFNMWQSHSRGRKESQKAYKVWEVAWTSWQKSIPNADKGEGVQTSENLVNVILVGPLSKKGPPTDGLTRVGQSKRIVVVAARSWCRLPLLAAVTGSNWDG